MRRFNTQKVRTRSAARKLATGVAVTALATSFAGVSIAYVILVTLEGAVK